MAAKKGAEKKNVPWGLAHEGIKPGSMKSISENKLKAFSVGLMNTSLRKTVKAKQDIEEKKKKEEEECAEVFADFVASFEDPRAKGKTFVRGNTINPETKEETSSSHSGKIYKPMAKFSSSVMEQKMKTLESSPKSEPKKKAKEKEKKKSNLELFKEELKRQQEEREIRHKIKKGDIFDIPKDVLENLPLKETDIYNTGSHDTGDPSTTNLYIGNINPSMNEEMLMRLFGKYGPLASVKIMWPRTDEEKARNRNCGFVAYMRRKDGEKALTALKGKDIMGYEMKLGWGKGVPIPPQPIYIPPEMQENNKPPPPSGLPFNAQPDKKAKQEGAVQENSGEGENANVDPNGFNKETLANAVVKVVIPTERNLMAVIHRCIEFVVREGPMFEAMIMNREINNPMFRFLFDNQTPEHIYYRWKLFSILQGDSQTKWKTDKFKMFVNGSYWKPPPCHQFTMSAAAQAARSAPLPASLEPVSVKSSGSSSASGGGGSGGAGGGSSSRSSSSAATSSSSSASKKGMLSARQRDRLEDLLREITPERSKIAESMVWCVDHADAAEEVVQCISESLSILETPLQIKVARLYLVSDILHNCSYKLPNMSFYRRGFQKSLPETFSHLNKVFKAINARMKAEQLRKQVTRCLDAWMDWAVYPPDFLESLESTFLGQVDRSSVDQFMGPALLAERSGKGVPDVDGIPLDIDGLPLAGGSGFDGIPLKSADLDGMPMDIDGIPMGSLQEKSKARDSGLPHVASKWDRPEWETVDDQKGSPSQQQSPSRADEQSAPSGDTAARVTEVDEARRKKLREIELKVAEYAQKLEAKGESNIAQQCNKYREKLLEASEPKSKKRKGGRSRSASPSDSKAPPSSSSKKHRKHRSRSRSSSSSRSRSRSPLGTSLQSLKNYQSRSPSPSGSRPSRSRSRSVSRGRSRSRSRSPPSAKHRKRKSRSRSPSPSKSKSSRKKRSRSRSRSPSKKKNKKKKK